jgi:hypothetical protein
MCLPQSYVPADFKNSSQSFSRETTWKLNLSLTGDIVLIFFSTQKAFGIDEAAYFGNTES